MTEEGDFCDLTVLAHVAVRGKGEKYDTAKLASTCHRTRVIPKVLKTRSDKPKYSFQRQG